MQHFSPVWVSTVDHLHTFGGIVRTATPKQLASVRLPVPDGFPQIRPLWGLLGMTAPLLFVAAGSLTIDDDALRFQARPYRLFGNRVSNVDARLTFELFFERIVFAERRRFDSPVSRAYDLEFVRIRSTQNGIAGDFLATLGVTFAGVFTPDRLAKRRDEFLDGLERAVAARGWGARARNQ